MKTKPTQEEIKTEIEALKNLEPVGKFKNKTTATIARVIDELEERGNDMTIQEWDELPYEQRNMIQKALYWKEGWNNDKPSVGWDGLVAGK